MPFNPMKKIALYSILSLFIFGCEADADIEVPTVDPMISATCYISPQDTIYYAVVSRVNPLFGDQENIPLEISNAIVTISNGMQSAQFNFDTFNQNYTLLASDFPVAAGETYTLRIEAPDYPVWTASTTVPTLIPQNVTAQITDVSEETGGFSNNTYVDLEMAWDDVSSDINYYRGLVMYRDTFVYDGGMQVTSFQLTHFLEDDGASNQGRLRKTGSGPIYNYDSTQPITLDFYLLHVNKAYFDLHKSLFNLNYSSPFSEPSLVYSNASGGLGCFGAFQQVKVTVVN
jgi:hypothetical protein